jgi:cytoskeletal protein RodZ
VASQVPEEGNRHGKAKSAESYDAINFQDNYLKPPKSADNMTRKMLIATAVLVGIAIIAWVVYFFLYHEEPQPLEPSPKVVSQPTVVKPDSSTILPAPSATDSLKPKTDTAKSVLLPAAPIATPSASNASSYNVVIEYANKERALKRFAALQQWNSHVKLSTRDSIYFKLFCTFTGPLSDTLKKKDSLSSYYGRKVYVELNP